MNMNVKAVFLNSHKRLSLCTQAPFPPSLSPHAPSPHTQTVEGGFSDQDVIDSLVFNGVG